MRDNLNILTLQPLVGTEFAWIHLPRPPPVFLMNEGMKARRIERIMGFFPHAE